MFLFKKSKKSKKQASSNPEIKISEKQNFIFTESCKALRTNVMFALHKEGCRRIMITSSTSSEGKTTIASHLALSFAQIGASVLLIDGDMRCGKSHRLFGLKRSPGLSNVLGGFTDVSSVIQKTKFENLYLISAGVVPPNAAELLASKKMTDILDGFSKSFDYIILDTPPVNVVSDAMPLANIVDGVIVVVRNEYTEREMLKKCVSNLQFANAKILGVVLNDAIGAQSSGRRYRYYYRGYRYRNYRSNYGYYRQEWDYLAKGNQQSDILT